MHRLVCCPCRHECCQGHGDEDGGGDLHSRWYRVPAHHHRHYRLLLLYPQEETGQEAQRKVGPLSLYSLRQCCQVTLDISGSPIESQWGSQKYPG